MDRPKSMARTYRWIDTASLQTLRSKKFVRLQRIEKQWGYLAEKEARTLRHHIREIDVELASREAQGRLF